MDELGLRLPVVLVRVQCGALSSTGGLTGRTSAADCGRTHNERTTASLCTDLVGLCLSVCSVRWRVGVQHLGWRLRLPGWLRGTHATVSLLPVRFSLLTNIVGLFAMQFSSGSCSSCAANTRKAAAGNTPCDACPANSVSQPGSASCACASGFAANQAGDCIAGTCARACLIQSLAHSCCL